MSPIVLKLGGSVVTDKDRPETLDADALDRTANAVASAVESGTALVVVHGGGSFGHHYASEHGITTTEGTHDAAAALEIHSAMKTLNGFVLQRLLERDVPALPVHPSSLAVRDAEGALSLPADPVETMLAEGFVPVLHGDLVAHVGRGATVVSGDELVVSLARSLEADRIGLCSAVPGVLDDDERVIERISSFEEVASAVGESESTDVTGGMAAKVRALLDLEAQASIFGLDEIEAFLSGEDVGTTVD